MRDVPNYRIIIKVEFREFDRSMLERSRQWLCDPELKVLVAAPDINREEQERWFRTLSNRRDYYICSLWRGDEPIGACGLKHITATDAEVWGYIGEKRYWGKTIGVQMLDHLIDRARSMQLRSLYAIISKENRSSCKISRRYGCKTEKGPNGNSIVVRRLL